MITVDHSSREERIVMPSTAPTRERDDESIKVYHTSNDNVDKPSTNNVFHEHQNFQISTQKLLWKLDTR